MLSCHRSVISRALPLLGLVLLLVLVASAVFAENGYGYITDTASTAFPYLSPVKEQRNVLFNAFGFQMLLFGGINGTNDQPVKALNYLAMTGVLVGALMIIFNAKNRKVGVLVPWLLLVIITVFAPYGSKLLFTPLAKNVKYGIGGESKAVTSCMDMPTSCGFTPQVLGIHIASLLQLTFSDLFNSHQWQGLIKESESLTNLANSERLVASPEWMGRVKKFNDKCGSAGIDWEALIKYRINNKQVATGMPAEKYVPQTMGEEWKQFTLPYQSNYSTASQIYPPRAIRLYDESDYPGDHSPIADVKSYWDQNLPGANIRQNYEAGLTALYSAVTADNDHRVVLKSTGEADQILASVALKKMQDASFFDVHSNICGGFCKMMKPGFLFVWKDVNLADAAEYRRCYVGGPLGRRGDTTWCHAVTPQVQFDSFKKFLAVDDTSSESVQGARDYVSGTPWDGLIKNDLMKTSDITNMPVGVVSFAMGNPVTSAEPKAVGDEAMMSCYGEGDRLLNEATSWAFGPSGKVKRMELLQKLLAGNKLEANAADPANTLPLEKIYTASSSCNVEACSEAGDVLIADALVKAYRSAERDMEASIGNQTLDDGQRFSALTRMIIEAISSATNTVGTGNPEEDQATTDSTQVSMIRNTWLTNIGGAGAIFFGKLLTGLGSWITGPLSKAIVYFLSLLVDMALLILVVLTPIMFVIALAMPGAAMGVMTIAVMGAFILKTVPITLLVLNNIGGMIYTMIGAGGGENSLAMQNIMILAMAGLYANIVGLTFFLLFKLGDPATVLSRFTALDGSAKQIADRGMAATIAAASVAALAVGGGLGAAVGWKGAAGMAAAAKKRLNDAVPGSSNVINSFSGGSTPPPPPAGLQEEENKKGGPGGPGGPGVPPVPEGDDSLPGREPPLDSSGKPFSPNDMLELNDLDTQGMMTDAVASGNFLKDGETDEARIRELGAGRVVVDDNGNPVQKSRVDGMLSYDKPNEGAPDVVRTSGQIVNEGMQQIDADINGKAGDVGALTVGQREEQQLAERKLAQDERNAREQIAPQAREEQSPQTGQLNQPGQQNQAAGQLTPPRAPQGGGGLEPIGEGTSASQQQLGESAAPGTGPQIPADAGQSGAQPNLQPGQSGAPVNVNVMNGIDVKSIPTGGMQGVEEMEQAAVNESIVETRKVSQGILNDPNAKQELKDDVQVIHEQLANAKSPEEVQALNKQLNNTLMQHGTSRAEKDITDEARLNLNQQVGAALKSHINTYGTTAELTEKAAQPGATDEVKKAAEHRKYLEGFDPVAVIEGEVQSKLAEMKNWQQDLKIIGAADAKPGFLMTVASGVYGGLSGGAGGLAKIPVIGSAISEATNELYQGAERARAWNTQGGFGKWWKNQGDAQRMGFYQKEMAPMGAATQYQAMNVMGGFEGQASLARQAANEAVARTFSQYQAMMANQQAKVVGQIEKTNSELPASQQLSGAALQDKIKVELQNTFSAPGFQANMSIEDLRGLGAIEAADRVASVRQEAFTMQHDNLKVMKAKLNDKMMLNTDANGNINLDDLNIGDPVNLQLTPEMLNKLRGDLASKKVSGNIDDMMITHYGLTEKQFLRGNIDWDATRHMTYDAKSAATFAMQDVSNDYLIGGHIKMVEGKYKYKESQGNYHTLVRMRHEEHGKKDEKILEMIGTGTSLDLLMSKGYDKSKEKGKFDNEIKVMRREALDKMAKSSLQKDNQLLPLEAVFDESYMNGLKKYVEKSMLAPLNQGVQNAKVTKTVTQGVKDNLKNLNNISESAEIPLELTMPGQGRARMRDSKEKLGETIVAISGKNLENIGRVNAVFMEELAKEADAILVNQFDDVENGIKKGTRGTNAIPAAAFERIKNRLGDEFKDAMEQNFKQVNGESVYAELEFNGKQRLVDSWKNN